MAALTIPEFLERSAALEARLREVLPEYTLLHNSYEDVRNDALPELNGAPGGNMGVNMVAADNLKADVDAAFAGVMNAIELICAVNNPANNENGNGNNMGGGRRLRKRRNRKTRRSRK
jgi:division protein CdvB (Snf7/Vps24/ESCRT-III family)